MKKRNPIAKAVKRMRPKVVPDKRRELTEQDENKLTLEALAEESRLALWQSYCDKKMEVEWLRDRINSLYDAIAHGDEDHRAWLRQAIAEHFKEQE